MASWVGGLHQGLLPGRPAFVTCGKPESTATFFPSQGRVVCFFNATSWGFHWPEQGVQLLVAGVQLLLPIKNFILTSPIPFP